jgi:hypothetical protein
LRTAQIVFIILAILLVLASNWLSMPFLLHAGMGSFGFAGLAIGSEAILTQRISLKRRRGTRRTYTGTAAVLQGVQFNIIGLVLIGLALALQFNINGRGLFLQIVRRPGLALVAFGLLLVAQSVITLIGAREHQGESVAGQLVLRFLPGLILLLMGFAVTGLGLFEVVTPNAFDNMGGGLLEMLYGIR